jgi:hypothetical protein
MFHAAFKHAIDDPVGDIYSLLLSEMENKGGGEENCENVLSLFTFFSHP